MSRNLARPLMSSIYFVGPINTLRNSSAAAKRAEPVTGQVTRLAQRVGLPIRHDPELMVKVNAGVQLASAAALASGRCPRLAAGVLAATLVPTTLAGHPFWQEEDPAVKAQQKVHFAKNLSLLGGLILAAVDTDGRPSKVWLAKYTAKRLRKQADHLTTTARLEAKIAALEAAGKGDTLAESLSTAGSAAKDRAHSLGDRIVEKAPEIAALAGTLGAAAAARSQEVGERLADKAHDKAPEWAAAARSTASDVLAKSQQVGEQIADTAQEKVPEWTTAARAGGDHAADVLDDWRTQGGKRAKKARKQLEARSKQARKELESRSKQARKEFDARSKQARKELDARSKQARKQAKKTVEKAKSAVA